MKTNLYVQHAGRQITEEEILQQIKEYWKQEGHKIKDIHTLDIYVKPEENSAYYTINDGEQSGRVAL